MQQTAIVQRTSTGRQHNEEQLFDIIDALIAERKQQEEPLLRRVHTLRSKVLPPMFSEFKTFLSDNMPAKLYAAISSCITFPQFAETMNELGRKDRACWDAIDKAVQAFAAQFSMPALFWCQAVALDQLNTGRNDKAQESLAASVEYVNSNCFKQESGDGDSWQDVKVILAALTRYASARMEWLAELEEQRQDSQRQALAQFNQLLP